MSDIQTPLTEKDTLDLCHAVLTELDKLTRGTDPATMDTVVERRHAEAEQQMSVMGVRRKDADDWIAQIDYDKDAEFDAEIRTRASGLLKSLARLDDELERQTKAAARLQPPVPTSAVERWSARTATILERQEFRQLAAAWSLDDLVAFYERTTDQAAPELIAFIEDELEHGHGGFPTLKHKVGREDEKAMARLTKAWRARQEARTPLHVREIRHRLAGAGCTDTRRMLIRELSRPTSSPWSNRRIERNRPKTAKVDGRTPEAMEADRAYAVGKRK